MKREAFSLIELMAVLLITALVAAAVTLRVQGPMRQSQLSDVIGQISAFDDLTRAYARQHDQSLLIVMELASGRLTRTDGPGGKTIGTELVLPAGYDLAGISVAKDRALGGAASIPCSRSGFTPTYAVELQDPYHKRHWLLFAGLSGQMVQIEDESQVQEIWAALGGRDDAR